MRWVGESGPPSPGSLRKPLVPVLGPANGPPAPDAHRIPVTFTNKDLFAQLALSFKLEECRRHTAALLRGLASILPPQYFALFTWRELEPRGPRAAAVCPSSLSRSAVESCGF